MGKFHKDTRTKNSTVHKRGGLNDRERVLASVVDPGAGPGGSAPPPVFLDQTEAQKAEKYFWQTTPLPFSKGLDDWAPSLSQGLDPAPGLI